MPLYMIERSFAEEVITTDESIADILEVNDSQDVEWLFSFLSADRKKTYCLYEAANPDAILEAARLAGLPADVIIPVSELRPEQFPAALARSGR